MPIYSNVALPYQTCNNIFKLARYSHSRSNVSFRGTVGTQMHFSTGSNGTRRSELLQKLVAEVANQPRPDINFATQFPKSAYLSHLCHQLYSHFHCAGFPTNASAIEVLHQPDEFYNALLDGIRSAKKVIVLSSLYLGTGPMEQKIIDTLAEACSNNKDLVVCVILDFLRGTRTDVHKKTSGEGQYSGADGLKSSVSMLLPLLKKTLPHEQVAVCFFHTPALSGIWKKIIPARMNEVVGVHHMKFYVFDDNVLMSGANLSENYFTNRQDRYMWIKNHPQLSNYYVELARMIGKISYTLHPNGQLLTPPYDPVKSPAHFRLHARTSVGNFLADNDTKVIPEMPSDTWIFPTLQMGPLQVFWDNHIMSYFLSLRQDGSKMVASSAYLNFTDHYKYCFLNYPGKASVLTASPTANGFFNAKDASKYIPPTYTALEYRLWKDIKAAKKEDHVSIFEYNKPGWTFHAKGLWYLQPNEHKPSVTVIGSANFGERSTLKDLEAQMIVTTTNDILQEQLDREWKHLFDTSELVDAKTFERNDHRFGIVAKFASWALAKYL